MAPQVQQAFPSVKVQFTRAPIAGYPEQKQIEYALLYSLANKTVTKPLDSKTINIMPDDLLLKYEETQRKQFERMLKILFVAAILVFAGVTTNSYLSLTQAKDALRRRAVSTGTPQATTSDKELSFSPSKVKLLGSLAKQNDYLIAIFDTIYRNITSDVGINSILYEKEKNAVIVIGVAVTRDALLSYRDKLEDTKLFGEVTVPFSSLENESNFEYRLIIELKAPEKPASPSSPRVEAGQGGPPAASPTQAAK